MWVTFIEKSNTEQAAQAGSCMALAGGLGPAPEQRSSAMDVDRVKRREIE